MSGVLLVKEVAEEEQVKLYGVSPVVVGVASGADDEFVRNVTVE